MKFDPDPLSCSTTHGKNSKYKGNLCEAPVSNKSTYWNADCTIWKSSLKSTDLNYSFCYYPVQKKIEGPLKFDPEHLSCSTTHGKYSEYKENLCDVPFSSKFTYWNSDCTIWKSSLKSTDWNYSFCYYPVQKKLRAHWNSIQNTCRAQRPMENTVNTKKTCAMHHFLANSPIEILIVPFERALWNLQTETIHFVIILCKKNWGPIEIRSRPPVVLNDPRKKQWIHRKFVRCTIF